MKNQIFVVLGLCLAAFMPNAIVTNAEEPTDSIEAVDIQGDYVSFDDITEALKGEVEEAEEGRLYNVESKVFSLKYGKGYSLVNEAPEPYLVEASTLDETVSNLVCLSPILFNEELFVPISYVERLLGLNYNDGVFEKDGEPLFKGEDFVVVVPPTEGNPEETPDVKPETPDVKPETPGTTPGDDSQEGDTPSQGETLTVKNVFVNKGSLKLEVGQSDKVNAVVDPFNVADATISWSSSDTNIITVDNKGYVYAAGEGTATLTVSSNMNPTIKATVSVTVTPPPVVNATSVGANKTWIDMEIGNSVKVSAWVSPENTTNKGITWSSENNSVATVDGNGNISAKGSGYTRIVATAVSNGSAKAYVEVNVKEKPAPTPTPDPTPTPTPDPTPTPTPDPTPKPDPAPSVVRGDSVVSQLLNEGFFGGSGGAFWHPEGADVSGSFYDVFAIARNGGVSLHVEVAGYYGDDSYSKAQKVLGKIIPSGASTVVGYIKNGQAGTYNFDGRQVVVSYGDLAIIDIN